MSSDRYRCPRCKTMMNPSSEQFTMRNPQTGEVSAWRWHTCRDVKCFFHPAGPVSFAKSEAVEDE